MTDRFASNSDAVFAPARDVFLISPHDSNPIVPVPKAIRANGAGNIVFRAIDSAADVTVTVVAGEVLSIRARWIRATGTTVAAIHGLA
jgi:hypothetical protein